MAADGARSAATIHLPDGGFAMGECQVDPARRRVNRGEREFRLEPRAMDVLVHLAQHAGRIVTRDELIQAVWNHLHVTDDALSRCISMLRHALGDDPAHPRFVETVPKRGYRLIAPVTSRAAAPGEAAAVTLAVLPMVNLSGSPADEHLADGITELLISNLAAMPALRVISRTSSMRYKGTRERLTDIAAELGVTRIIEGSVLRSDRQIQVVVQLIDPATDMHLFSRSYTRPLADMLMLQNEMAWAISDGIGGELANRPARTSPRAVPVNEVAMNAYLRARHFWAQRTPESFDKALREYAEAIALAPDFARAHAGLAMTWTVMAFYGIVAPGAVRERAREASDRALALDPDNAECIGVSGAVKLLLDWDLDGALPLLREATERDPSYDIARLCLGDLHLFRREFDAALREIHLAVRYNPFDLGMQMNVGDFLVFARRYDEAVAQFRRTLDIGPHFWPARCRLAQTHALMGDGDAARVELVRAADDLPVARAHQPVALVHAQLGDRERAQSILVQLERERGERYVPAFELARIHATLGDAEAAFAALEQGFAGREPMMLSLAIDPFYDRIRGDRRFADCLRRVGLAR